MEKMGACHIEEDSKLMGIEIDRYVNSECFCGTGLSLANEFDFPELPAEAELLYLGTYAETDVEVGVKAVETNIGGLPTFNSTEDEALFGKHHRHAVFVKLKKLGLTGFSNMDVSQVANKRNALEYIRQELAKVPTQ